MPYVASDGSLQRSKPFGLGMIMDLFYGTINMVNVFFRSLFHMDDGVSRGHGQTAPRMPGRRMGGIRRTGGVASPPPACFGGG